MHIQNIANDTGDNPSVVIPMGGVLFANKPDPIQVRDGITRVYDFRRNDAGYLVAAVTNEGDIRRFLSIRDAFAPYGDEALAEAVEKYRWRARAATVAKPAPELPPGQPPVTTEIFDDDGKLVDSVEDEDETGDEIDSDDETDPEQNEIVSTDEIDGIKAPADFTPPPLGELPEVPDDSADGSVWMAYAAALPGITPLVEGLSKEKAKEQAVRLAGELRDYAHTNYGADLTPNKGVIVLAREVGHLQRTQA